MPTQTEIPNRKKTEKPSYQLSSSIQYLTGVGPKRAEKFAKLDVRTLLDLLYLFPRRYIDATTLRKISSLKPDERVTVLGKVIAKSVLRTRSRMQIFNLVIDDGTGALECYWFNQPYLEKFFFKGENVLLFGDTKFYRGIQLHPKEYQKIDMDPQSDTDDAGTVIPIYPSTEGLYQKSIRKAVSSALAAGLHLLTETLTPELLNEFDLLPLRESLKQMHYPDSIELRDRARYRLVFEEFFFLELMMVMRHHINCSPRQGIRFEKKNTLIPEMGRHLPFKLTEAQKRVLRQIDADMSSDYTMNRLIQGDVGSGKTVVALFAMLRAVENECQAALMAPTEVLAEQHYRTLCDFLRPTGLWIEFLKGGLKTRDRKDALNRIRTAQVQIIVGTHALIQEDVDFFKLGLVVIDEQHRFGVNQRATLRDKGYNPDCLVMTATPIPRSLALTLYGDLDVSQIDELPPGRQPVITRVVTEENRKKVYQFLRDKVREGNQVYVVLPLVEESEKLALKAVTQVIDKYKNEIFPQFKVGMLHGRMPNEEKEYIMRNFKEGRIDILVSTTVIEVGVDVANASIMMIEHADRFGLSQLHQLRGRVGRGEKQSYCILFPGNDQSQQAQDRLRVLLDTNDGFKIAEADLKIRGPGDFFGTKQHGLPELKIADIIEDQQLLFLARQKALEIVRADPLLEDGKNSLLRKELYARYKDTYRFIEIG